VTGVECSLLEIYESNGTVVDLTPTDGFNVTSNSSTVSQGYKFTLSGPVVINKYVGIASTDAFPDPLSEAQSTSSQALSDGFDALVGEHRDAWDAIWDSADIEVPGNEEVQLSARSALFHLWSNVRNGSEGRGIGDTSIAPAGLTSDSYAGQIFWDADTFMYPGLLVLSPDFASSILNYRAKNLGAAMENAKSFNRSGALYPWTGYNSRKMHLILVLALVTVPVSDRASITSTISTTTSL
jgi:trehalose/maltose hydrolase-like predicted phosphorylase